MSAFKTCQRRYYLRYVRGLVREQGSAPLRLGGAVHRGLELLSGGATVAGALAEIADAYGTVPEWADANEWLVEAVIAGCLVEGYAARWGASVYRPVAVELPFHLAMGRATTTFSGKIDRIVTDNTGTLFVLETKTTSEAIDADSDYWLRLRIDTQISGYILAARHLGHNTQSIIYDVIRKPGIRPRNKPKAETVEEYAARLRADITERPTFYYARREIPRLDADIADFHGELWRIADDIAESEASGIWYRNTAACVHPYRCEYFNLCTNGFNPDDGALPSGFTITDDLHPELAETPPTASSGSTSQKGEMV
jgi:RecB family exonuclease